MNPANMQQMRRRSPSPGGRRAHSHSFGFGQSEHRGEGGRENTRSGSDDHRHGHPGHHPNNDHGDRSRPRVNTISYTGQHKELESMAAIERPSVRGSINHHGHDDEQDGPHHHHHHHHHHDHNHSNTSQNQSTAHQNHVPSLNRTPSLYTPGMQDKLRRKLKVFFMDPCSKVRVKRQWPWKLSLQLLKIILVTAQLVIFGQQRSSIVQYFERNHISLKHLLLKGWDPSFETLPYPPATGQYALYTRDALISHMNFAMNQYYRVPDVSVGSIHLQKDNKTVVPISYCWTSYTEGRIFQNGSFIIDPNTLDECIDFSCPMVKNGSETVHYCNILELLNSQNLSIEYDKLLKIELKMKFLSYHLDLFISHSGPACFSTDVAVIYDNTQRDGQMLLDLKATVMEIQCHGEVLSEEESYRRGLIIYDAVVIILCVLSLFLCLRSLFRAQVLKRETMKFFMNRHGKKLTFSDKAEFLNLWYVLIVCNDILTTIGSAFKIQLEDQKFSSSSENYDRGSVALGIGCLMGWIGALRYLGFFEKYNILILTLKKALPNVLRFSVCTLSLYFGFMFCGWLVLGPYHIKFRHLSTTSECLFSLVNGDDMFVTFSATMSNSNLIWYFSRVYLYSFISLFIYIVLSLFIAVIMDTYETIKYCYENGFPKSEMWEFMDELNEPAGSDVYKQDHKPCCLFGCFCCGERDDPDHPTERTHLLSQSI